MQVAVTPQIWVGGCPFPHRVCGEFAQEAAVFVSHGATVMVASLDTAATVMRLLGATESGVSASVGYAQQRWNSQVPD